MIELGVSQIQSEPVALGLFIAGIVFISAWLLMRIRKRAQRGPAHPTAREVLEQYKQRDGVRDDLQGLMVEIEQLAKRVGAQLDAKAMHVEKLIDDADLRIAQLQQAMRDQHGSPAPAPDGTPESSASPADLTPASVGDTDQAVTSALSPADELAAKVHRLADDGLAPAEIARQLEEHVGKIELILALRQA